MNPLKLTISLVAFAALTAGIVFYNSVANSPEIRLEIAVTDLTNAMRSAEAIESFNAKDETVTPTPRTFSYLSLAYYNEGDIEHCHEYANKAVQLNGKDDLAAKLFILTSGKLKKFEKAHAVAQEWLRKSKIEDDVIQQIIIFYNDTESYDNALNSSTIGIQRFPKDDTIAGTHAHTLAMKSGADVMLDFVDNWTSKNKPTAYFWENVGRGLYRLEKYDQAIAYFNKSLDLNIEQGDVVQLIAEALQFGETDIQQIDKIAAWAQSRSATAELQNQIGVVYYLSGDKSTALEFIEKAWKQEPENPQFEKNRNTVLASLDTEK